MYLFIWIFFCLHIFITYQCATFSAFFLCLHACILSWFFHFIMTFPPHLWLLKVLFFTFTYAFIFIYCLSFYILLVLLLIKCAPFLQHSRFCWNNSYTPHFSLKLACISSCLSFCPSLCKFFHMPPHIWISHLRISFHALSLTMILSSWSFRGSYFAFVYTYLMLNRTFTSSHGLLGPSLFLVATCVCKTK